MKVWAFLLTPPPDESTDTYEEQPSLSDERQDEDDGQSDAYTKCS